jgi:hypothetical protein
MLPVALAELEAERGLVGDRYARQGGNRQVTLISAAALRPRRIQRRPRPLGGLAARVTTGGVRIGDGVERL